MITPEDLANRARIYANSRSMVAFLEDRFGFGQDGRVWQTNRKTAIKVFERQHNFETELACYQRLKEHSVIEIGGLQVPQLVDFDNTLQIVEITIVKAPFIIDFGKCYIDRPPPYDANEIMAENRRLKRRFGENFSRLQIIFWQLKKIGIHYWDAKKSNVRFTPHEIADEDEDEDEENNYEDFDEIQEDY
jgi:hypothetical protein